jgi:hypothetical protein
VMESDPHLMGVASASLPAKKAPNSHERDLGPFGFWGGLGLSTPFSFYPRGPGYVRLSLVYDTLIYKTERVMEIRK